MEKEVLDLLRELTPDIFETIRSRIIVLPTAVKIDSDETENMIDYSNLKYIQEIKERKFHPEFNILHISTDGEHDSIEWKSFLKGFDSNNIEEKKDEVSHISKTKYLHLMIPQYSNGFVNNLINGSTVLTELQELAVQADFNKLDDLLEYLRILSESSSTSTTPKLKYVMAMNQNLDFETAKEVDDEIFEMTGQHSGIIYNSQSIDSLEVTVKGDFTIHTCEASYSIKSPKEIRVGGTLTLEIVDDRLFLLADALIEVSANTSIVKEKRREIQSQKFMGKNVFEIPLRSIKMTVFKNKESYVENIQSYCLMLEILEEGNPSCYNSL